MPPTSMDAPPSMDAPQGFGIPLWKGYFDTRIPGTLSSELLLVATPNQMWVPHGRT